MRRKIQSSGFDRDSTLVYQSQSHPQRGHRAQEVDGGPAGATDGEEALTDRHLQQLWSAIFWAGSQRHQQRCARRRRRAVPRVFDVRDATVREIKTHMDHCQSLPSQLKLEGDEPLMLTAKVAEGAGATEADSMDDSSTDTPTAQARSGSYQRPD